MTSIDKAAIVWTIVIVAVGAGLSFAGLSESMIPMTPPEQAPQDSLIFQQELPGIPSAYVAEPSQGSGIIDALTPPPKIGDPSNQDPFIELSLEELKKLSSEELNQYLEQLKEEYPRCEGPARGGPDCPDSDEDRVNDLIDNCSLIPNSDQADANNNGIGNACEGDSTDTDVDGIPDNTDNCPTLANLDQKDFDLDSIGDVCDDSDNDGLFDPVDNCPSISNKDQKDFDLDSIGDVCDDSDNDGLFDSADNCPSISNSGQENFDLDSKGDACDDSDGDDVLDSVDNCPSDHNPNQENTDFNYIHPVRGQLVLSDDLGDACDDDDDNDGLSDELELAWCTLVLNPDTDGDTKLDGWEIGNHTLPYTQLGAYPVLQDSDLPPCADEDEDGIPNQAEELLGLESGIPSTDGDAYYDGEEFFGTGDHFVANLPIIEIQLKNVGLQLKETNEWVRTTEDGLTVEKNSYTEDYHTSSAGFYASVEFQARAGIGGDDFSSGASVTLTGGIQSEMSNHYNWGQTTGRTESTEIVNSEIQKISTDDAYFAGTVYVHNSGDETLQNLDKLTLDFYVTGATREPCYSYDFLKFFTTADGKIDNIESKKTKFYSFTTDESPIPSDCMALLLEGNPMIPKVGDVSFGTTIKGVSEDQVVHDVQQRNLSLTTPTKTIDEESGEWVYGGKTQFIHLKDPTKFSEVLKTAGVEHSIQNNQLTELGGFKSNIAFDDKPDLMFTINYQNKINPKDHYTDLLFENGDSLVIKYGLDSDEDGLHDMYEIQTTRTDPEKADTDGDGLWDGEKTWGKLTGEKVPNWWVPGELTAKCLDNKEKHYDPLNPDTDGDGVKDPTGKVTKGSDGQEFWRDIENKNLEKAGNQIKYNGWVDACKPDSELSDADARSKGSLPVNYINKWRSSNWGSGWNIAVPFEHVDMEIFTEKYTEATILKGSSKLSQAEGMAIFEKTPKTPRMLYLKTSDGTVHVDDVTPVSGKAMWRDEWDPGWTTVAPIEIKGMPHLISVKSGDGEVSLDRLNPDGYSSIWTWEKEDSWTSGWTTAAPIYINLDQSEFNKDIPAVLFIKKAGGTSSASLDHITKYGTTAGYTGDWSAGWDKAFAFYEKNEEGKWNSYMFVLKSGDGTAVVYKVTTNVITQMWRTDWTDGYDNVAPFTIDGVNYALSLKSSDGTVSLDIIDSKTKGGTNVWNTEWSNGWNTVAAFTYNDEPYIISIKNNGSAAMDKLNILCLGKNAMTDCEIN